MVFDKIYDCLINEDGASVGKDMSDQAYQEVPKNFCLLLLCQFTTKLADACSNAKTVLPWLLVSLGTPAFLIGLLVPIRESGSLIPQLVMGGIIRRYPIRKWFFVAGACVQGVCLLLIVLVSFVSTGVQAGILIIGLLILFSLARGLCSLASKDVLGKTVPKTRRGRLNGYSASFAGLLTIVIASVIFFNVASRHSSHITLLFIAVICWCVAAIVYTRVVEFKGETMHGQKESFSIVSSIGLLKTDIVFRQFVIVRALLMGSGLAAPYFVLLAMQQMSKYSAGPLWADLAMFVGVSGIASLASGGFWGRFADSNSQRLMQLCSLLTVFLCLVAAYLSYLYSQSYFDINSHPTIGIVLPVVLFFLLSVIHQGVRLGRKTYAVDMAEGNRRTTYVAVANTVIGVLLLGVGIISAAIAQLSDTAIFIFFAVSSALAGWFSSKLPTL